MPKKGDDATRWPRCAIGEDADKADAGNPARYRIASRKADTEHRCRRADCAWAAALAGTRKSMPRCNAAARRLSGLPGPQQRTVERIFIMVASAAGSWYG